MFTLPTFFTLFALLHSAVAGPACAHRHWKNANCLSECAQKWGFPGSVMGNNPWGVVMKPSDTDMATIMSEACGVPADDQSSPTQSADPQSSSTLAYPDIGYGSQQSSSSVATSASRSTSVSVGHAVAITLTNTDAPHTSPRPQSPSTPPPAPSPTEAAQPSSTQDSPSDSSNSGSNSNNSGTSNSGSSDPSSNDPSSSGLESDMLAVHNSFRAQHGAPSMTWNNEMAAKAQQWANGCVFKHSGGTLGPFGENLAAGTGTSYTADTGFDDWTSEESQYDPNNPVPSHFTQVVWKSSVQLGCATQTCPDLLGAGTGNAEYLVCEYFPQGNVIGQFPQNVQL